MFAHNGGLLIAHVGVRSIRKRADSATVKRDDVGVTKDRAHLRGIEDARHIELDVTRFPVHGILAFNTGSNGLGKGSDVGDSGHTSTRVSQEARRLRIGFRRKEHVTTREEDMVTWTQYDVDGHFGFAADGALHCDTFGIIRVEHRNGIGDIAPRATANRLSGNRCNRRNDHQKGGE
jgi:hypothetical protein